MEGYWSSLDGSLLILLLLGLSSRNSALYSQPTLPHPTFSQCNPTLARSREATLLLHLCSVLPSNFPPSYFRCNPTLVKSREVTLLLVLACCCQLVALASTLPAHCQHIASTLPAHWRHRWGEKTPIYRVYELERKEANEKQEQGEDTLGQT